MSPTTVRRILVVTPWVPYPVTGACQQDRFAGLKQMQSLGYELHVIAKIHAWQNEQEIRTVFREHNIPLILVPYISAPWTFALRHLPQMLLCPALIDGAAREYIDAAYQRVLTDAVRTCRPDVIWIEYSCLWPVLRLLRPFGIPMILKSSLLEAQNCMDEHGRTVWSWIKSLPKHLGERIAARESDVLLAITPDEEAVYRRLGAKKTDVLPLRGLSNCFVKKIHGQKDVLDIVFLSSNYNMGHNRDALMFLLGQILPLVRKELAGKIRFHLTGKKFPDACRQFLADDVRTTGFIDDLGEFLATMDGALCPWITGAGMQQKVFEPLCRSLPLLTTKTAGYWFENGKEVLLCKTPQDYVAGLKELLSPARRNELAENAYIKAEQVFSNKAVINIMKSAIEQVTEKNPPAFSANINS